MIELMPAGVNIPLCGSIPAGFASDREQQPEWCDSVDVATIGFKATRNTFALRVVGDSMIGKHICADDSRVQTVLISLQRPIAEAKQELRKESSPEPQSS
jgi:SOS-response transcriptional repressor LexA